MHVKNKVRKVNEATTQPLTDNAQDLKKALIKDEKIIEHVFATNMKNVRKDGNRYYFKYPGEWITASMKHVIGVRGLYLVKANRFFYIRATLYNNKDEFIGQFYQSRFIKSHDDMFIYFDELNNLFKNHSYHQQYGVRVCFSYEDNGLLVSQYNDDDRYRFYYYTVELDNEILKYMVLDPQYMKANSEPFIMVLKNMKSYVFIILWNRCDELELRASFVKQTEYQHLGFTNNLYTPLKQYELECADSEFWVDLYTNDQKNKVILPDDSKDLIVIETQLILKP